MSKGITKDKIIETAEDLIAEKGLAHFSMHEAAARLGVRTASLYSHVSGITEVITGASADILSRYVAGQKAAASGLSRSDALFALADSEKKYAEESPYCYELIMNLQVADREELRVPASSIIEPIMDVLDQYDLTYEQKIHAERAFRACVYGFISQEKHGYFAHIPVDTDQSFHFTVQAVSKAIENMEQKELK